jgi:hypothetical protein
MRTALLVILLSFAASACVDPVHDERVAALGPEAPGVEEGELHRPGQPCTVCHGDKGPGSPSFGIAGTLFATDSERTPLAGATVRMVDERLRTLALTTNAAGNFYAESEQLSLSFPFWVSIDWGGRSVDMLTPVFRSGSCAECHADPAGPASVGHVYFEARP